MMKLLQLQLQQRRKQLCFVVVICFMTTIVVVCLPSSVSSYLMTTTSSLPRARQVTTQNYHTNMMRMLPHRAGMVRHQPSQPPPPPPPHQQLIGSRTTTASSSSRLNMMPIMESMATMDWMIEVPSMTDTVSQSVGSLLSTTTAVTTVSSSTSSLVLAFADQGQNLAGIFFQASLLPYLLFLYFLSFRANRIPNLANFGFQFLLLFVIGTIPSGIISKSVYGYSLADTDWLHGGAEALLTMSNILVVLGLKQAMTTATTATSADPSQSQQQVIETVGRNIAFGIAALFVAAMAIGPSILQLDGHAPFLLGIGNLPTDYVQSLPFVSHSEPPNALSIPTWAIHFSSVIEYVLAMNLIWDYAVTTRNSKWKGLTWGMLPLHASGICACTYHFFYNPSVLQFLVTSQAGLTLLGNITLMIAAFRIASSNGWTLNELNPLPRSATSPIGLVSDGIAAMPLDVKSLEELKYDTNPILAAKLIGLTVFLSYFVKYGELGIDVPFSPNPIVASSMIVGIPAITAYNFYRKSQIEDGSSTATFPFQLPFTNNDGSGATNSAPSISMADVKKYGVAGTVAYILTELAFWIVAFPVAATALYQGTGHWPDVITDVNDRTAVIAFVFAGANIARLLVPLRFGAALALAPWVDTNIIQRIQQQQQQQSDK